MVELLALSLISAGKSVVGNVIDACSSTSTTATTATKATSFDSTLKTAVSNAANPYTGMDATTLTSTNTDLEKKLADSPDIKAFLGNDKKFTITSHGGTYSIQRSDGTIWNLPKDSEVANTAKSLCQCRTAQAQQSGSVVTGAKSGWAVDISEV